MRCTVDSLVEDDSNVLYCFYATGFSKAMNCSLRKNPVVLCLLLIEPTFCPRWWYFCIGWIILLLCLLYTITYGDCRVEGHFLLKTCCGNRKLVLGIPAMTNCPLREVRNEKEYFFYSLSDLIVHDPPIYRTFIKKGVDYHCPIKSLHFFL